MKWYEKAWLYIKQGAQTVASWFKKNPEVTNAALVIASANAGYAIAKNNPKMAPRMIEIADKIIDRLNTGTQTEIINALFADGVKELVEMVKDPMMQMNLMQALRMIQFDAENMNLPPLPISTIKDFIISFRDGARMGLEQATK